MLTRQGVHKPMMTKSYFFGNFCLTLCSTCDSELKIEKNSMEITDKYKCIRFDEKLGDKILCAVI